MNDRQRLLVAAIDARQLFRQLLTFDLVDEEKKNEVATVASRLTAAIEETEALMEPLR